MISYQKKFILSVTVLFSSALALSAQSEGELAKKLLSQVIKNTKPEVTPMAKLPQNFGGKQPKLDIHQQDKINKIALGIASSDEREFQGVLKDVVFPLERMFEAKRVNLGQISEKSSKYSFKDQTATKKREVEGIAEFSWSINSNELAISEAETAFNDYLSSFSKVDYVSLSPYSMSTPISQREAASNLPKAFEVEARMDLRGMDSAKSRRNDRGVVKFNVSYDLNSNHWKVTSFKMVSGETLTSKTAAFAETSPFDSKALSNFLRKEAIRRGGYALAVNDLDGDGVVDMIVGHLGALQIYKGKKDGSFDLVSNKSMGFNDETLVKSAVIADFDNDGKKDVLLTRFAPSEKEGNDIALYQNQGGSKFKKVEKIQNRSPAYYAMPSAVADFNGDGMLDFYVGFPGAKDFTVLNKKATGFEGKKEFLPQGLFYNIGNFSFNEVTKERLPYSKKSNAYTDGYPEMAAIFPHASMAVDYNLDGNMDIVVIDDKANLSPLYKNNGKGTFEQVAEKIGLTNYDFGMGFAAGDLSNRGSLDFVYTNVNFLPAERLHNSLAKNFSDYSKLPGTYGLRVFRTADGKNYSDISALTGVNSCGQGIAGVELVDYNNDGLLDIYVANGLWSGTTKQQDLSSLFVRAYSKYDYDFQEVLGSSSGVEQANTSFMKILNGFEGDLESQSWQKGTRPSMAGYQRNCLFRNNGDDTFTEVGYLAGVDSMADGYMIATADLNQDGKMDLILRNGDPGVEQHRYPAVQVFTNNTETSNKSVILSFFGHKSNRDGIGVIAEASVGGKKLTRHLIANNGAVQSESILHFGLGKQAAIDELTVRWPSGNVQKFKNVPAGRHLIEESNESSKVALR
ncbi:CRTAC1 family protein [bacterium]|nr:CRTAC1 family protein [bacterium]